MAYDIFISYRRKGGADKARPLKSELERRGYKVFLDFDELKDGVFDKRIMDAIEEAPIFLVILSAHSLDRCKNDDDWVRKEIEYAIEKKRHFVPVNPNKEFDGFPIDIPEIVKEGLGAHQFSHVDFEQLFKVSIDKMISERIEPLLSSTNLTPNRSGALVRVDSDLECCVLDFGKEIARVGVGMSEIRLPKGKHKLSFIGVESDAERYDCMVDIRDLEYEEYVEVKLLDKYNARKAEEKRLGEEKARQETEAKRLEEERRRKEIEAKRLAEERAQQEAKRRAEEKARQEAEAKHLAEEKVRQEVEQLEKLMRLHGDGDIINGVYRIGDYYNDGRKQGVVFEVSADGRHGKIVSLQQSEVLKWAVDKNFGTFFNKDNPCKKDAGAYSKTDGMYNMRMIKGEKLWKEKYPAFAWCAELGDDWYLPAIDELKMLLLDDTVYDAVNRTLEDKGATKLANKNPLLVCPVCWSSTEADEFRAWSVGVGYGGTEDLDKYDDYHICVRAVSAFSPHIGLGL